ncbi:hypothetical protein ACQCSV_13535 [Pseudarthrobacter sp. S3]|uniref:hypothetical protein n=1 Tax=Pseudarthrobacter sp. S3 TaxID=3418419 RepID=UPI003CF15315
MDLVIPNGFKPATRAVSHQTLADGFAEAVRRKDLLRILDFLSVSKTTDSYGEVTHSAFIVVTNGEGIIRLGRGWVKSVDPWMVISLSTPDGTVESPWREWDENDELFSFEDDNGGFLWVESDCYWEDLVKLTEEGAVPESFFDDLEDWHPEMDGAPEDIPTIEELISVARRKQLEKDAVLAGTPTSLVEGVL